MTASLEGLDLTVLSRTVGGERVHEMRLARDSRLVVEGGLQTISTRKKK